MALNNKQRARIAGFLTGLAHVVIVAAIVAPVFMGTSVEWQSIVVGIIIAVVCFTTAVWL